MQSTVEGLDRRGLRLLSLDGGGIRGISELIILEEVMHRIKHLENLPEVPRPCDYFDLIGGVGTGGLFALMLGKLHMSAEDAITAYSQFAKQVYSQKKFGGGEGVFKATQFEISIKDIIKAAKGCADAPMRDTNSSFGGCESFVGAIPALNMSQPRIFRSYEVKANQSYNCAIWEAARATAALPKFFKSILIGKGDLKEEFLGAGLGWNNPLALVLKEAESLYGPTRGVACIISIGTGHPKTISWQQSGVSGQLIPGVLVNLLQQICSNCEQTAEETEQRFKNIKDVYFRLRVEQGMQLASLDDWQKLGELKTHTTQYLSLQKTSQTIDVVATLLSGAAPNISISELNGPSLLPSKSYMTTSLLAIPPPTTVFVGRDNILLKLSCLFSATSAGLENQSRCVLYGLGGAGKTQIALKFIEQSRNRFSNIYFIDATTIARLEICFRNIGKEANIQDATAKDGLLWLSQVHKDWLLLFDNADDPSINLQDFFPPCSYGNIIITTRNTGCCVHAPGHSYEVAELSPSDATKLFLLSSGKIAEQNSNLSLVTEIVEELGYLALAIVHAGAYLMQDSAFSLKSYLDCYRKNRTKYHTMSATQTLDSYKTPVYTTWEISYAKLSKPAAKLLQICACFYHNEITTNMFQKAFLFLTMCKYKAPDSLDLPEVTAFMSLFQDMNGCWDEFEFRATLQTLCAYSLILKNGEEMYRIHPLVHAWAGDHETTEIQVENYKCAWQILFCAIKHVETTTYRQDIALASHIDEIWAKKDIKFHYHVLFIFAWLYHQAEQWNKAGKLYVQSLDTIKQIHGPEHPDALLAASNLAMVYSKQGQWKQAEQLEVQVLEARKRLLGNEHSDTLISMTNLATTLSNQGHYAKAEKIELQVMEARIKLFGTSHLETLTSMGNLASTYSKLGRYKDAEILDIQVVEARKVLQGEEHPDTLFSIGNLAVRYYNQGRYSDGKELLLTVLASRQIQLGDNHSDTLLTKANLATMYSEMGQWNEAKDLRIQVLQQRQKLLGEFHPNTLVSLADLAVTYSTLGQYSKAQEMEQQILKARKSILGEEHPDTLVSMANLAITFSHQGHYKLAEELQVQVLEITQNLLGKTHPDTLLSMESLAVTYSEQELWSKALPIQLAVLEARKELLGVEHPDTLSSMANLALAYRNMEEYDKAVDLQLHTLQLRKKVFGDEHPDTLHAMVNLASTYSGQGHYVKAKQMEKQALDTTKQLLGEEHPQTILIMGNLAVTYFKLCQWSEALELQTQSVEASKKVLGIEHPKTVIRLSILGKMQERSAASHK